MAAPQPMPDPESFADAERLRRLVAGFFATGPCGQAADGARDDESGHDRKGEDDGNQD